MAETCKFFSRVFFKDLLCFQRFVQNNSEFIVLCLECKIRSRMEAADHFQQFAKLKLLE